MISRPALIAPDANIEVAARRIVWGKLLNSGQTCIAPDYVLFPRDKEERLMKACKKAVADFYGEVSQKPHHYPQMFCQLSRNQAVYSCLQQYLAKKFKCQFSHHVIIDIEFEWEIGRHEN